MNNYLFRLLFIGELPNSLENGVSISNKLNLDLLKSQLNVVIIEEKVYPSLHTRVSLIKFFGFVSRLFRAICIKSKNKFGFIYLILPTSFFGQVKTLLTILILKFFYKNAKFVVHLHRGDLKVYLNRSLLHLHLFRFIMSQVSKALVLSENLLEGYENNKYFDKNKFHLLPNTVHNEMVFSISRKKRSHFSFIYISHYIEEKGHQFLLQYFSKFNLFDFKLVCFGKIFDPKYFKKISLLNSHAIMLCEEISGDTKFDYLLNSDFFIMPSLNEGQPLVILEAMMCGLIIIANDVGFIREMFWKDYPFIYKGNNDNELDRIMSTILTMTDLDIMQLRIKLKNHYFCNYSNVKHEKRLLNSFKNTQL